MEHFLSVHDLSPDALDALFSLTEEVKREPQRYRTSLDGRDVGLFFMKPSTRTRVSFEVGINQLGGRAVVLSSQELQLGRGETVADTARVLSRYLDAIMARVFAHSALVEMAQYGSIPVINGLSDLLHPCQALADYYTLRERLGPDLRGVKLAYVGDGNNVAHSLILGGAKLGVDVSVATPPGYAPLPRIVHMAEGAPTAGRIHLTTDATDAVAGAHVVYTDVWASMGQEAERRERHQAFARYQVDLALFELADPAAIFMHCLPAHRGEEVAEEVADHPRSVIFDQAENRLHSQKALLIKLLADG